MITTKEATDQIANVIKQGTGKEIDEEGKTIIAEVIIDIWNQQLERGRLNGQSEMKNKIADLTVY